MNFRIIKCILASICVLYKPKFLNAKIPTGIFNPGQMGPNAMPIQPIRQTSFDHTIIPLTLGFEYHRQFGKDWETTANPVIDFFLPLGKLAGLRIFSEPIEFFHTSEKLRQLRNARHREGVAKGDLYFGQSIQILRQERSRFDLALNITTKTTTGKGEDDKRHTNSPGYIIDFTQGKKFETSSNFINAYKFSSYLSFIAWQTGIGEQNDAAGYNLEVSLFKNANIFSYSVAGFYGWQKKYDIPIINRYTFAWEGKHNTYSFQYTYGIRDAIKHSIQLGITTKIPHLFLGEL